MQNILFAIGLFISSAAMGKDFVSARYKTEILELFSSEGCSSCPPAERQISQLQQHKGLWVDFIPINFHVDYWNRLGWTDPYSKEIYTQRQHQYAKLWNVKTVYTPAFAFQNEDMGPVLKLNLLENLKKIQSSTTLKVNISETSDAFKIKVQVIGLSLRKPHEVYFTIMGHGFISKITTGENSGRTLTQNFVALATQTKMISKDKIEFVFSKTESLKSGKLSFVAWVTEKSSFQVIQSVGGYL